MLGENSAPYYIIDHSEAWVLNSTRLLFLPSLLVSHSLSGQKNKSIKWLSKHYTVSNAQVLYIQFPAEHFHLEYYQHPKFYKPKTQGTGTSKLISLLCFLRMALFFS
jgi:hypothetical protein